MIRYKGHRKKEKQTKVLKVMN